MVELTPNMKVKIRDYRIIGIYLILMNNNVCENKKVINN